MTTDVSASFSTRDLFGGALTASLPTTFLDASDARPVPSNQEVFTSPVSSSLISLIFDILEAQAGTPAEVVKTHFEDVVEGQWQVNGDVAVERCLGGEKEAFIVRGSCSGVGRVGAAIIFMAVVRLENVGTDLVITTNVPAGGAEEARMVEEGAEVFKRAVESLKVLDWGLFGDE